MNPFKLAPTIEGVISHELPEASKLFEDAYAALDIGRAGAGKVQVAGDALGKTGLSALPYMAVQFSNVTVDVPGVQEVLTEAVRPCKNPIFSGKFDLSAPELQEHLKILKFKDSSDFSTAELFGRLPDPESGTYVHRALDINAPAEFKSPAHFHQFYTEESRPAVVYQVGPTKLIIPEDYQIAQQDRQGTLSYTSGTTIPANAVGIAIGPKTLAVLKKKIQGASLIFFNGLMGFEDRKETLEGTKEILKAMSNADGKTIIAGGDSVSYAHHEGLAQHIDYVSTGGGATMTYLSGQPLRALNLLLEKRTKTK